MRSSPPLWEVIQESRKTMWEDMMLYSPPSYSVLIYKSILLSLVLSNFGRYLDEICVINVMDFRSAASLTVLLALRTFSKSILKFE